MPNTDFTGAAHLIGRLYEAKQACKNRYVPDLSEHTDPEAGQEETEE